jgi:hypothetical protein
LQSVKQNPYPSSSLFTPNHTITIPISNSTQDHHHHAISNMQLEIEVMWATRTRWEHHWTSLFLSNRPIPLCLKFHRLVNYSKILAMHVQIGTSISLLHRVVVKVREQNWILPFLLIFHNRSLNPISSHTCWSILLSSSEISFIEETGSTNVAWFWSWIIMETRFNWKS